MKLKVLQREDSAHEMIYDEHLGAEFDSIEDIFKALVNLEGVY